MKVFVSSTCYDLLDLRAELNEDLRDLGVEPCFSDIKESDFDVPNDAITNSIETCLVNLRGSDKVIIILSQRYGPPLPKPFSSVSATHLEYQECMNLRKPILFYIRDRLVADWAVWIRNGRPDGYKAAWAKQEDIKPLFSFIEEHLRLVGGDGEANRNNWYWPFSTSVDLRADIRSRLSPDAFRATGEKLVKAGQTPVILIHGQGIHQFRDDSLGMAVCFSFDLVNAGSTPALAVQASLHFHPDIQFGGNDAQLATLIPGDDPATRPARQVRFNIRRRELDEVFRALHSADGILCGEVMVAYRGASAHNMVDISRVTVEMRSDEPVFASSPVYLGKRITGMSPVILT